MVVTLEPCAMCAAAIGQARVGTLIYGAREEKTGAVHSTARMLADCSTTVVEGVLAKECADLLSRFFEQLRERNRPVTSRGD